MIGKEERLGFSFVSGALLSVIIAVVGFGILLLFLLGIDFYEFGVDETCKLSVLTRATLPGGYGVKEGVPLKCTTKKICITDSLFGKCEQFVGRDNVEKVILRGSDVEKAREIEKVVAENMYACWKMMGEGKLDLAGRANVLKDAEPVCVICDRVALDDDFRESGEFENVMKNVDINSYLENRKVPNGEISYLSAFTDRSVRAYGGLKDELGESEGRFTTEIAHVYAQINTEDDPEDYAKDVAKAGFTFVGTAALTPQGRTALFTLPGLIGSLAGIGIASGYAYLDGVEDQTVSAGYCGEFDSGLTDENGNKLNRKGCSVLSTVDYKRTGEINRICAGGILGNP